MLGYFFIIFNVLSNLINYYYSKKLITKTITDEKVLICLTFSLK